MTPTSAGWHRFPSSLLPHTYSWKASTTLTFACTVCSSDTQPNDHRTNTTCITINHDITHISTIVLGHQMWERCINHKTLLYPPLCNSLREQKRPVSYIIIWRDTIACEFKGRIKSGKEVLVCGLGDRLICWVFIWSWLVPEEHGSDVLRFPSVSVPMFHNSWLPLTFLRYLVVVPTPKVPFLIALAVKWFNTTWFGTASIELSSTPAGGACWYPGCPLWSFESHNLFESLLTMTLSRIRGRVGGAGTLGMYGTDLRKDDSSSGWKRKGSSSMYW